MSYQHFTGTKPVAEQHAFDEKALARYIREHVEDFAGDLVVEQFKGGQSNPTFLVKAGQKQFVLRRKPLGQLLPSAHAVDREFKVIKALANTDVPVAKAHVLCMDDDVIGSAFYLMDFVPGRILWDPSLPEIHSQQERQAIYAEMNRVIAALHSVDPTQIGLGDFGRTGGYFARQIERWTKQYRASETEHIEAMENLIKWLPEHIPDGDETRIVHGDYRLDNVIFHPTEPKILAVLDWELSTLGHPLADFAYHCMAWRRRNQGERGLMDIDIQSLGIPSESEYVRQYCQHTGRESIDPKIWEYYIVFNMFRLAGILQGVMSRALKGNASNALALEAGKRAKPLAIQAWSLVEKLS